jgi:uncharacterized protein YbjT (DUF2867 family)
MTCAAGNQAPYILPLLKDKIKLRLACQSDASAKLLKSRYPHAEVVQGDMRVLADCARMLSGVTTVYNIGPGIRVGEKEMGLNMVEAAIAEYQKPNSQFKHFVEASVLNTQIRKMFNHDDKRYVEEQLILSPLRYTILQPGDFFEAAVPVKQWLTMEHPVRPTYVPEETWSSFVALKDLGEAAAKVILERERHYEALYPLVSLSGNTYGDCTTRIGEILGKKIEVKEVSWDEAIQVLLEVNFGGDQVHPVIYDKMAALVSFYRKRGIKGNPTVLEWLLERDATSLEGYVAYKKDELRAEGAVLPSWWS